jgi:hypothetical protein
MDKKKPCQIPQLPKEMMMYARKAHGVQRSRNFIAAAKKSESGIKPR